MSTAQGSATARRRAEAARKQRKVIMATVGPELHEVTSEQVGILKLMKLAVETDRFMQQLKKEGREQYSIGEYVEKVYNPVMNL